MQSQDPFENVLAEWIRLSRDDPYAATFDLLYHWRCLETTEKEYLLRELLKTLSRVAKENMCHCQFNSQALYLLAQLFWDLWPRVQSLQSDTAMSNLLEALNGWMNNGMRVILMDEPTCDNYRFYDHYRPALRKGYWYPFKYVVTDHHYENGDSIISKGLTGRCHDDFMGSPLLWFSVQAAPEQQGPLGSFETESRYGSSRFRIRIEDLLKQYAKVCNVSCKNLKYYVLGTRHFKREWSHVMLVSYCAIPGWLERIPSSDDDYDLFRRDYQTGSWEYYCARDYDTDFDHPEFAFAMPRWQNSLSVNSPDWSHEVVNHSEFCVKEACGIDEKFPCYFKHEPRQNGYYYY